MHKRRQRPGSAKFFLCHSKTDSPSVGFSLNGTRLRIATLHVSHSKDEGGPESGFEILSNLFILSNMAERAGFEFTRKRSFNTKERTAGTVRQWKTVVRSANGSHTDH